MRLIDHVNLIIGYGQKGMTDFSIFYASTLLYNWLCQSFPSPKLARSMP